MQEKKQIILLFLVLHFFLSLVSSVFSQEPVWDEQLFNQNLSQAQNELSTTDQYMQQRWVGSRLAYETNLQEPLVTGGTLTTLDGTPVYVPPEETIQLMCPGKDETINILIQFGPTKDLNFINITYDYNLDGNSDGILQVPGPISGICANGFIKCLPGTWNQCKYYAWNWMNNALNFQQVSPGELGGCYCINSYCTSAPYINYKDQVLRSLGGGIAAALTNVNPSLGISGGEIDGFYIRMFTQRAKDCQINSNDSHLNGIGLTDPDNVNSALLGTLGEQEVQKQQNNENSPYYILTNSQAFINTQEESCIKQRSIVYSTNECEAEFTETNGCTSLENDPDCQLKQERVYDLYGNVITTWYEFNPTGLTFADCTRHEGSRCEFAKETKIYETPVLGYGINTVYLSDFYFRNNGLPNGNFVLSYCYGVADEHKDCFDDDGSTVIAVNGKTVYQAYGYGERSGTWNIPIDPSYFHAGNNELYMHVWGAENDSPSGQRNITLKFPCPAGFQEDSNYPSICFACPNGYTYDSTTKLCKHNYCYNWWKIERVYVCQADPSLNPDMTRLEHVAQNIQETDSGIRYNDIMKQDENSAWQNYNNINIDLLKPQDDQCIPACKLRKFINPAQVAGGDFTSANYRHDPSTIQYIYRKCIDNTCPIEDGEEMLEGCQCVNEFNSVIAVSEVIKLSAMDMICSSGTKY